MEIPTSYTGSRPTIRVHVPAEARRVLDLGCSTGAVGRALKAEAPRTVTGVELDPEAAREAREVLDRVVVGDLDDADTWGRLGDASFDCVLVADVLEHCRDPWTVFARAARRLRPGGRAILSVPNVAHYSTHIALLRRRWPYNSRGVHDATHLRWFAEKNVADLVEEAGLQLRALVRQYRLIERPHPVNGLACYVALPGLRNLLTHQFIAVGERASRDSDEVPEVRT